MRQTLAGTVVLDSSPVGCPSVEMSGDDLVALSRSVGGGFQQTCHHAIHIRESKDTIVCDLMALHYLPVSSGTSWFTLLRAMKARFDPAGKIAGLQTLSEQQTGNPELLGLVQNKEPHRLPTVPGDHVGLVERFFTALRQRDAGAFEALWLPGGRWSPPFSNNVLAVPDATTLGTAAAHTLAWRTIDTNDPALTIVPYDQGIAVFHFRDGRIWEVEDYQKNDA